MRVKRGTEGRLVEQCAKLAGDAAGNIDAACRLEDQRDIAGKTAATWEI